MRDVVIFGVAGNGFLALDLSDESASHDEDEFVERVEMTLSEAIAAIATGEIQDMKTVAGLTLAERHLAKQESSFGYAFVTGG